MYYVSSDFELSLCVGPQCNNNKMDVGNVCDAERTVRHSEYSLSSVSAASFCLAHGMSLCMSVSVYFPQKHLNNYH